MSLLHNSVPALMQYAGRMVLVWTPVENFIGGMSGGTTLSTPIFEVEDPRFEIVIVLSSDVSSFILKGSSLIFA